MKKKLLSIYIISNITYFDAKNIYNVSSEK